jgi:predicted transcriptional regulator
MICYDSAVQLHVPPELAAKLNRLAAETGRKADRVALDLLTSSVDHEEWFRNEVQRGRASARDGRLIDQDVVAARVPSSEVEP